MVAIIKNENGSVDKRQKVKSDNSSSNSSTTTAGPAIPARQTAKNDTNPANKTVEEDAANRRDDDDNKRDDKNSTSNSNQQHEKTKISEKTAAAATAAILTQDVAAAVAAAVVDVAVADEGKSPQIESNEKSLVDTTAKASVDEAPKSPPVVVRLRQKGANHNRNPPLPAQRTPKPSQPSAPTPKQKTMQLHEAEHDDNSNELEAADAEFELPEHNGTAALIQRTMGSLYEASPDMEDNTEEIRKLDSQLDHLNEYMDKVEERLKSHSEKLMETLKQQKEEREKRRRSFHERLDANRQEDDDFQRQLSQILNRVDISLKRQSAYEITLPPMPSQLADENGDVDARAASIPENPPAN